jgi:enoyl-CoA hydratase/carnithine racemase
LLDGGGVRLPYLIGLSRALDLIITGRAVQSDEALDIGLANRLVPNGKAIEESIKLATQIAKYPQESLKADRKTAFYSAFNADSFYDALTYEYRKGVKIATIKDSIEGALKFQKGIGKKGSFEEW